jgi:hypothetical protein
MFDFSLFSINSMGLRYGASKLFQILMPLLFYIVIRDFLIFGILAQQPWIQHWIEVGSKKNWFQNLRTNFPQLLERALGFMAWKIGCDLGFFLIVTGLGPWSRAFTWAGLIPYTLVQYVFYYWLGRRVIIGGESIAFWKESETKTIPPHRPAPWTRWVAKYLHEDMNVTSETVPLRQVFLKPIVDYWGLVLSWSLYTIGMFFSQSGEINWLPLVQFSFFQMLTFYLVNTYGYILGFNLGELVYLRISELQEIWFKFQRQQSLVIDAFEASKPDSNGSSLRKSSVPFGFDQFAWFDGIRSTIDRYGLTGRWLLSASGGVFCIMILAPTFASFMLFLGHTIENRWFQYQGAMNEGQTLQIEQAIVSDRSLPNAQQVIDQFPQLWEQLYLNQD